MNETKKSPVYIVDDDDLVRQTMAALTIAIGFDARCFSSGTDFLDVLPELTPGPTLLDVRMPGIDGLIVLSRLRQHWASAPVIMMSGQADIPMAVKAMQSGATDFVEKPIALDTVRMALEKALESERTVLNSNATPVLQGGELSSLTKRETEVFRLLVRGNQNKQVANKLGISHRTVEVHRARIMKRLNVTTLAQLVRIAIQCGLEID